MASRGSRKIRIAVDADPDLHKAIKEIAKMEHRSLHKQVIAILEEKDPVKLEARLKAQQETFSEGDFSPIDLGLAILAGGTWTSGAALA